MAVTLSPFGGVGAQFFDNSGNPLTGGKLYSYAAGTTTPQPTYTTASGLTAHTNPIVLDAAGRVPNGGEIWLTDGQSYKFVLKTSTDTLIATYDNIVGINSNFYNYVNQQEIQIATAGQTVFTLTSMVYLPGTNSLSVFVDGVNQYGPGASYAYEETDGTTVTFASGLHVGAEVKFTTSQIQGAGAVDASQVSYVPPFVNSVATNVEAKLAQTVSVIDFGADPTGVADSTSAFQNAIDAVGARGAVYIPQGNYVQSGTVTIPGAYTGIHIRCDGYITYTGTTRAWVFGDTNRLWEAKISGLYVVRAYTTPFETGLQYTAFAFKNIGECEFDGLRCQGFRWGYSLSPETSGQAVTINTWKHCTSQDCYYNVYAGPGDADGCFVTANMFFGGYHVTNQQNFTDPVTQKAALVYLENPYRLTRSGNTVDGNVFTSVTIEQPVHRKIYCEGNGNSWVNCYFDTGSKHSGHPFGLPLNTQYPFHQSSPISGFTSVAGSNVITKASHGLQVYISTGDSIGVVNATNICDNAYYVCTAIDANTITLNKNLASTGTLSITQDTANIEFTGTAVNNEIIGCSDVAYQQITSVATQQTNAVVGGKMGFTQGPFPEFGANPSVNLPFGFSGSSSIGSINIVGTTPSGGDEGMQGALGNINNGDLSSYTLKFIGLDSNQRMSAYAAIKANKEGRNTSTAYGGLILQVRANTTNQDLVDAVVINSTKAVTFNSTISPNATDRIWTAGAGSPEGAITAKVGSLYTRTDGGAGSTLYVKESGSGNTGWVGK